MNKSLLGSLDSPSGWDVPLFCQNQIGESYNFPLVWFTWKISTYSSTSTRAHAPTRTQVCSPIWTPDLFQPSDSHWHLPLKLRLLTCWSWWEWMMFLLEEKKREGRKRGWGAAKRRSRVDKLSAALGIHLDPLLTRKVTGRANLTSSLQKEPLLWPKSVSYNMASLPRQATCHLPSQSTVIMGATYSV